MMVNVLLFYYAVVQTPFLLVFWVCYLGALNKVKIMFNLATLPGYWKICAQFLARIKQFSTFPQCKKWKFVCSLLLENEGRFFRETDHNHYFSGFFLTGLCHIISTIFVRENFSMFWVRCDWFISKIALCNLWLQFKKRTCHFQCEFNGIYHMIYCITYRCFQVSVSIKQKRSIRKSLWSAAKS